MKEVRVVIRGTGSYIPERVIKNDFFADQQFYDAQGNIINKTGAEVVKKFEEITEIKERRYADENVKASDMGAFAAEKAIKKANINPEDIVAIIVAHNFGDIDEKVRQTEMVPSLAGRIKNKLGIKNPSCIAYDMQFGCPGWLEATIQAIRLLQNNPGKYALTIGTETLSRVSDPYDRDRMLYGDGAGATLLQAIETDQNIGFLAWNSRSDTAEELNYLSMAPSFSEEAGSQLFLKMNGRKVYEYALKTVPGELKKLMDKANVSIDELSMLLLHQANPKMNNAILKRFLNIYNLSEPPKENFMPLTVQFLGNTSVASIPTMLDLILENKLPPYKINSGDVLLFASVGAGMNINGAVYKWQ